MTLGESLRQVRAIVLRPGATPAERTAASIMVSACAPGARIKKSGVTERPSLRLTLVPDSSPWYSLTVEEGGSISLSASAGSLLIALATLATESWADRPASDFRSGERTAPAFRWLRNLSDFLVGSLRGAGGFDRDGYCRQLARQGFTHVTVNGLGAARPFESGPPGDLYHWFYEYSPDLDQFVDSRLLKGYYPARYLASNLAFLKKTAALAARYGLTPGLHINSPRTMPEAFWNRYGFLRGARVDHPRETLRPRYTLAMAHPAVQEHYRELLRKILKEIPELGFIHLWTNDSGSGFEFVSTLYAGRNGGPYLLREWKGHQEIARKAGENVLTYFHLLRDEGRRNPPFRLICDIGPFVDERPTIIAGMGSGIDAGDFAYFEGAGTNRAQLQTVGAETHVKVEISENNVLGVPFPRLVHERLSGLRGQGVGYVLTGGTPASLAPFDINREIVRAFQLTPDRPLQEVLQEWAGRWGGALAAELLEVWNLSDSAIRAYPEGIPMSTFSFPWFRLWIRPFVPDIDAIPEKTRRYYEKFLLATFNNPARIDLNNDMMWNFLTPEGAGEKKHAIDEHVCTPLDAAIECATAALERADDSEASRTLFGDLLDRLRAARCYYVTMRNTMAWTESVHGYCRSTGSEDREFYRSLAGEMVGNEMDNTRDLLALVQTRGVRFMPVLAAGETLHGYGKNFEKLLKQKIALMEEYGDREPRVDPGYMWRMPKKLSPRSSVRSQHKG
jgi:hypothetical protein